jgi:Tfp pilus assembly protein PilV
VKGDMMKKRRGETLVEVLIAFVIILIAVSISVIASSTIVNLRTKAKIKSDIYDIVYSQAEEQLSTSQILPPSTITRNEIVYAVNTATSTIQFFSENVTMTTITVYPIEDEDDFKIEITVFPKQ